MSSCTNTTRYDDELFKVAILCQKIAFRTIRSVALYEVISFRQSLTDVVLYFRGPLALEAPLIGVNFERRYINLQIQYSIYKINILST